MKAKYWGGSGTQTAAIRPLDAEDFKELVERQINVPVVIPMTREQFFAHTDKERNEIKAGPYITGCSFPEGTTHRNDANADSLVLVTIDLDESEDAKRFVEAPEVLAELLWPYSFVAYHTASSRPEAPRLRIMVDLLPCGKEFRRRTAHHIIRRLGIAGDFKGERESRTTSQPMYRPIAFLGEQNKSPVLASRTDGQALDVEDIPEEESDGRSYVFSGDFGDDLGLAYLPVQNLTVEDIRPVLYAISPDIGFEPWSHIIAALRHQFRDPESAEAAFHLFDEWSSGSTKYKDGEPYMKWRSFTPDPKGKAPRTVRTIFKLAIEAGWNSAPFAEKMQAELTEWINNTEDTPNLLEDACKRINAIPFHNTVVEEFLITVLQKRLSQMCGSRFEKAAIRKELAAVKYQKRVEERGTGTPDWLRPFVYVGKMNLFHNLVTGEQLIPESFDNMFGLHLVSKDPDSESAKTGRPAILPRYYALNQIQIDRVHDTLFCPLLGSEAEPLVKYNGQLYLNTYLPSSPPAMDAKRSKEAGKLFREHMRVLIPDETDRRHVIDFLCHQVQKPGVKIPWAIFIQSAEGVGKGFLGKMMMGVLGKPNVKVIGPQVLTNQWNDWQVGAIFAILEELHIPGHQREAVMNAVKVAISDTTVPINKRNTHAFDAPNYTNYLAFSNFEDALHLKPTDRRWHCVKSGIQTEEQVMELTATGHFERMEPLLEELAGALRHWMMNRPISDTFPRQGPAPKTKYRQALIENSKNPMLVAIERMIEDPDEPMIGDDVIHLAHLETMTGYLSRNNAKPTHYLRMLGYERWNGGEARECNGQRTEFYVRPSKYVPELGDPDEVLENRMGDLPI